MVVFTQLSITPISKMCLQSSWTNLHEDSMRNWDYYHFTSTQAHPLLQILQVFLQFLSCYRYGKCRDLHRFQYKHGYIREPVSCMAICRCQGNTSRGKVGCTEHEDTFSCKNVRMAYTFQYKSEGTCCDYILFHRVFCICRAVHISVRTCDHIQEFPCIFFCMPRETFSLSNWHNYQGTDGHTSIFLCIFHCNYLTPFPFSSIQ